MRENKQLFNMTLKLIFYRPIKIKFNSNCTAFSCKVINEVRNSLASPFQFDSFQFFTPKMGYKSLHHNKT